MSCTTITNLVRLGQLFLNILSGNPQHPQQTIWLSGPGKLVNGHGNRTLREGCPDATTHQICEARIIISQDIEWRPYLQQKKMAGMILKSGQGHGNRSSHEGCPDASHTKSVSVG